jgi:hypothetical protein
MIESLGEFAGPRDEDEEEEDTDSGPRGEE